MDDLDELLGSFDLAPKITEPMTSEEHFMYMLCEGKHQKIHNLRYHIHRELMFYDFMKEKNSLPAKITYISRNGLSANQALSPREYAALLIEYSLQNMFAASFEVAAAHGGAKIDVPKLVDMICDHDVIKDTINNAHSLR